MNKTNKIFFAICLLHFCLLPFAAEEVDTVTVFTGSAEKFFRQYELTPANIIERVYRQPFPNRFLADISPFLAENIEHPAIHSLVLNAFKSFLTRNVMQFDYTRYKAHFIGSVAYYYKDILEEAAAATGMDKYFFISSSDKFSLFIASLINCLPEVFSMFSIR